MFLCDHFLLRFPQGCFPSTSRVLTGFPHDFRVPSRPPDLPQRQVKCTLCTKEIDGYVVFRVYRLVFICFCETISFCDFHRAVSHLPVVFLQDFRVPSRLPELPQSHPKCTLCTQISAGTFFLGFTGCFVFVSAWPFAFAIPTGLFPIYQSCSYSSRVLKTSPRLFQRHSNMHVLHNRNQRVRFFWGLQVVFYLCPRDHFLLRFAQGCFPSTSRVLTRFPGPKSTPRTAPKSM